MNSVLNLYKRHGETPLQAVERYVALHPEYKGAKMTYAGRLDPMAEGVLIVLAGDKNKEREAYTGLPKEYEFEFVLGVETDTFDVLGKLTGAKEGGTPPEADIAAALKKYEGRISQAYPPYSSKVVGGVPLFDLARRGKLAGIVLPRHEVEARSIEFVSSRKTSRDEFAAVIEEDIGKVIGDFRQDEIRAAWRAFFKKSAADSFVIFKARVSCGSGFYVRQLVSDIGRDLGTGAVTIHILRTRVGEFKLEDSTR
ncbi:MAG: hypothetical protein WC767_00585 [Candidatus Paceibacterota bacterium]|jgi:tRNA pseudouridine55 synthase